MAAAAVIASTALDEPSGPMPLVPLDPACQVLVDVRGVTVTTNLVHTLHSMLQLPALRDYYLERFHWSWDTFDTIDWANFHLAFKDKRRRAFLVKLCLKKLPVGERLHRWADHYDSRCPHCLQPDETDDHLFQCTDSSRSGWRSSFLASILEMASEDWGPTLVAILTAGLQSVFTNSAFDPSPFASPGDTTYSRLMEEQSSIGWDNLLRGKWPKEWGRLQFEFKNATNKTYTKDPVLSMIRHIWNQCHTLWLQRNGKRHGTGRLPRDAARRSAMRREITELYALKLLPADEALHFHLGRGTLLEKSLPEQKNWLTVHSKRIRAAHKVRLNLSIGNTKPLETYFERRGVSRGRGIRVPRRHRRVRVSHRDRARRSISHTPHITQFLPLVSSTRRASSVSAAPSDSSSSTDSTSFPTRPVQRPLTSYFHYTRPSSPRQAVHLHPDHPV